MIAPSWKQHYLVLEAREYILIIVVTTLQSFCCFNGSFCAIFYILMQECQHQEVLHAENL